MFLALVALLLLFLSPDPNRHWGFWIAMGMLVYVFARVVHGTLFLRRIYRRARQIEPSPVESTAELAKRGYLTISPDAIGFEDRNWADGSNVGWFELSSRLVVGRTLLADLLQEVSLAIDYATSLPQADPSRVGFIGHSYGGRMAMWAPAWEQRIRASVSNCGCIPYRDSFARDAGFQADFVVPGFASAYDVEDVLAAARACRYLLIADADDVWSRGAADIAGELPPADEITSPYASGQVAPVPCRRPRGGL